MTWRFDVTNAELVVPVVMQLDSRRIAVARDGTLAILDLQRTAPTIELPLADLHDFALVDSHVWTVAGAVLAIYDLRGERLATAALAGPGRFVRAHKAATWLGPRASHVTFDAGARSLAITALASPPDQEVVLALSPSRTLVLARRRLALREQETLRWTHATPLPGPITAIAPVFDGKAIAIAIGDRTSQAIVVVGLRDGAILHRLTVGPVHGVHFAAARGVALLHTLDGRLVVLDLRFGRVLAEHHEPRPLARVALDDAGGTIALAFADDPDGLVTVEVAELATFPTPATFVAPANAAPTTPTNPPPLVAPPAAEPFFAQLSLACTAVAPRIARPPLTAGELATIDLQGRALALATAHLAIARAWDAGRLASPLHDALPFHAEVGGLTSASAGRAADEVREASVRLEEALAAPAHPLLATLGDELGLSPLARDIAAIVAAPRIWGELARLYGILCDDEARPLVDEQLVGELLRARDATITRVAIARELDDDGPLVRHGVVRPGAGHMRPFLDLAIDPVVARRLVGAAPELELPSYVEVRGSDRSFGELHIPVAIKEALALALSRAGTAPLRLVLRGRVGAGRHAIAAAVAAAAGRRLGIIDATALVRDGRIAELAVILDRVRLAEALPCIDGLELVGEHDLAMRDRTCEILRRHPGPLVVRLPLEARPPLAPGHIALDLPVLSATERLESWRRALARHGLRTTTLDELADRYAIGPGVIEQVAAESSARGSAPAPREDAGPAIEGAIRQHLESRLGTIAHRVTHLASWDQIVLPSDIEDSLTELIARVKHRRLVFDQWGYDRVTATARGVTALFAGGPGTGKTMVATAIANELGMDLYRVDLSRIMSKWIGETEQNLARLFDAAEDGNTIILFDEADSLFAKRTEVKSSVDRYANSEVNYLLQRIDTFQGIAILTTNFGTAIDAAFKRRLSLRLTFPFPDEDMREKLWRSHLPAQVPVAGAFDLAALARRFQMSGGYIRNAALRAAFLAAEEHAPLSQRHLERAVTAEFREIGKIAESGVLE